MSVDSLNLEHFIASMRGIGAGREWLWMGVAALFVVVALMRHPLRRHLSDAFDFLRTRRLPLWITLLALGLEEWRQWRWRSPGPMDRIGGVDFPALSGASMEDWQRVAGPLVKMGVTDALVLLHEAIPPMPLAALLPVWVVMATVGLVQYPYRYQREKLRPEQRAVLFALSAMTVVWSGVYLLSQGGMRRADLEAVLQPLTLLFAGPATAAYQVWLARAVIQWAEPREVEMTARDETIARWQNVLWLGLFDAAWKALHLWIGWVPSWLQWSSLAEVLLVFAPLPVAIAAERGSLARAGGRALRMLGRGWPGLLLWVATAAALRAVGEWCVQSSAGVNAEAPRVVRVLMTGLLHAWLLPAAMLLLYRRGFPSQDAGSPQQPPH